MKKPVLLSSVALMALFFFNCDQAEDIKESFDTLECANLIVEINERWDDDDPDCSEMRADIDNILKSCGEFLDADDKAQLEFYKANCSDD